VLAQVDVSGAAPHASAKGSGTDLFGSVDDDGLFTSSNIDFGSYDERLVVRTFESEPNKDQVELKEEQPFESARDQQEFEELFGDDSKSKQQEQEQEQQQDGQRQRQRPPPPTILLTMQSEPVLSRTNGTRSSGAESTSDAERRARLALRVQERIAKRASGSECVFFRMFLTMFSMLSFLVFQPIQDAVRDRMNLKQMLIMQLRIQKLQHQQRPQSKMSMR
jgi:hypothetical protein